MVGKEKPEARKLQVNRNNRNICLIIEEYSREENTQTISELPGFNYSLIFITSNSAYYVLTALDVKCKVNVCTNVPRIPLTGA